MKKISLDLSSYYVYVVLFLYFAIVAPPLWELKNGKSLVQSQQGLYAKENDRLG